jgi:hypothetical protein
MTCSPRKDDLGLLGVTHPGYFGKALIRVAGFDGISARLQVSIKPRVVGERIDERMAALVTDTQLHLAEVYFTRSEIELF